MENNPEIPELPKPIPVEDPRIKELTDTLVSLDFFSNQTKFNSTVYNALNIIYEKLVSLEAKLNEAPKG